MLARVLVACGLGSSRSRCRSSLALAVGGVLAYWIAFYGLALSTDERALVRGLVQPAELAQERRLRSRSEVSNSIPAGHSIPTSGSSKRKPDSAAGS